MHCTHPLGCTYFNARQSSLPLLPLSTQPRPPPARLPAQPYTTTPLHQRVAGYCGECSVRHRSPQGLPGPRWPIRPHHPLPSIRSMYFRNTSGARRLPHSSHCRTTLLVIPALYQTRGSNLNGRVLLVDLCNVTPLAWAHQLGCPSAEVPSCQALPKKNNAVTEAQARGLRPSLLMRSCTMGGEEKKVVAQHKSRTGAQ